MSEKPKQHEWERVEGFTPRAGATKPGQVGNPDKVVCKVCGLVKDGMYADFMDAYSVYNYPNGKFFERWAHKPQPDCGDINS